MRKGRPPRPVYQLDPETGEILKSYESISAAARDTGAALANIHGACNGVYKTCCGFRWRYADA